MRTLEEIFGESDREDFLFRCHLDFEFFAKNVIHEIQGTPVKLAPFHREWIWAAENCKRTLIQAPTGFHKTGVLGIMYPIWYLWRNKNKEILLLAQIIDKSQETLEKIASVLKDNELLSNMLPKEWSKQNINLWHGNKIFCRAFGETVKGVHVDRVLSDEVSQFVDKNIYHTAVVTRVERKLGNAIAFTTPISETDLSMELLEKYRKEMLAGNLDYFGKVYPAEDGLGGNLLWPEEFPLERLRRIRIDLGDWAYYQQYLCSPMPFGSMLYPPELIEPCLDSNRALTIQPPDLPGYNYLGVDLAISSSSEAANTAYIGLKKLIDGKLLITHVEWQKGFKPDANKDTILSLYNHHRFLQIWVDEATFGPSYTESLINAGMPIWGIPLNVQKYRNDMLMNLRIQFEKKNIIIPNAKDSATQFAIAELKKELIAMAITKTEKTEMPTFKSSGAKSDLVMALGLAVKGAANQMPYVDVSVVSGDKISDGFGGI